MTRRICKALLTLAALWGGICLATPPGRADVIFYDSLAAFQASSLTSVVVTFDPFAPTDMNIYIPPNPPIRLGGVTFTPITSLPDLPNLFVATPAGPAARDFAIPLLSNVLTASGNEDFDLAFSTAPTAVGFDTYTNIFAPPVVSVYDTGGSLLAQHTLTQVPGSLGFLGIVSDVPIGRVNWLATNGEVQDTGIDNVRVGVAAAIPEPGSLTLVASAVILGVPLLMRRRRPR